MKRFLFLPLGFLILSCSLITKTNQSRLPSSNSEVAIRNLPLTVAIIGNDNVKKNYMLTGLEEGALGLLEVGTNRISGKPGFTVSVRESRCADRRFLGYLASKFVFSANDDYTKRTVTIDPEMGNLKLNVGVFAECEELASRNPMEITAIILNSNDLDKIQIIDQ